jgi:putative aminopeptidase FrvX
VGGSKSGTAALLEIARAYMAMKPAPRRSILFLATTAEEAGLLGVKYYTFRPLYPLDRTLANINGEGDDFEVKWWQGERWADICDLGPVIMSLDDALKYIASEPIFRIYA